MDHAVKCPANVTKKLAARRERHFRNSGILPSNRGTTGGAAGARVDKMVRRTNPEICAHVHRGAATHLTLWARVREPWLLVLRLLGFGK